MNIDFSFILKFVKYKLTAKHKHGHGIHSPFVYTLLREVIEGKEKPDKFAKIEGIRKKLLRNSERIVVEDLGAGSKVSRTNKRKISTIAKNALTKKKYARLLFRLVKYFKSKTILEFGTSLGTTTMYLAAANGNSNIISMEGGVINTSISAANVAGFNFAIAQDIDLDQTQIVSNRIIVYFFAADIFPKGSAN